MTWFYADGGRQLGPVEESALDDLVRQGVVRDDTLVWREGMASWQAHGVVRPRPAAPPPPAPAPPPAYVPPQPQYTPPQPQYTPPEPQYTPPQPQYSPPEPQYTPPQPQYSAPQAPPQPAPGVEMRYCAECGRGFPAYELSMVGAAAVCGSCRPVVMQRMGPAAYMPPPAAMAATGRRYAGFWIRFLALIIDGFILFAVSMIIRIPLMMIGLGGAALAPRIENPEDVAALIPMMAGLLGISFVIQIAVSIAYEVYFLSSRGATLGKMALGLKVIRADGGPISVGLALGRFFGRMLSGLTLYIGFIIAGFDSEKRSLHDRICDTRVIYSR
jgi:uncharacterized RDD family membrane protein YckC